MQPGLTSGGVFAPIVDLHRELHRALSGVPSQTTIDRVAASIWQAAESRLQSKFQHQPELLERVHSALVSDVVAVFSDAKECSSVHKAHFEASVRGYEGVFAEMAMLGLAAEANAWASDGRERQAELSDARRLFDAVVANPIGARNGFVWFELGWILDALGEQQIRVSECFYHSQRLLRGIDSPVLHRARLLMNVFEESGIIDSGSVASLLNVPGGLAVLAKGMNDIHGHSEQASILDSICLIGVYPESPLAEAMLENVRVAVVQGIQQRTEWNARLSALITLCESATQTLDIELPSDILDRANQLQSLSDRFAPGQDANDLTEVSIAAREFLAGHLAATDKEIARLDRLVAGAIKERDYWMNSVRSIEAEAKEGGFELHAYSITNPFKRKLKERQEQTRLLYEQCKANLEKQEGVVVSQMQRTSRESQRHMERRTKLQELIDLIDAPRLGIAASE